MVYVVLLALAGLDSAGYSMIAPVVPEIGEATDTGPGVMGVLVATFAVGQLVGYPIAGRGVTRRRAIAVLVASLALIAIGDLGFILGESLSVYFPARFIQGIGAGGLWIGVAFAVIERYPGSEYQRLTGLTAAYGIGAIVGPAMGAAGGIRAPFVIHLVLMLAVGAGLLFLGAPRARIAFESDRAALRTAGFWLASAGILMVALTLGTFDGPMPIHFSELLSQAQIGGLFVISALLGSACAALAGRYPPRPCLALAAILMPSAIALGGLTESVPIWILVAVAAGVGLGFGEAGSLGVLLESIGLEKIVLAMVIWSQVWAIGYLAGPAAGGGVAEALGFGAIGLVPFTAALLVLVGFLLPRFAPARSEASRA
jgi:MFS family permease